MSWWVKNVESFYRPPESAYTSKRATIICDTPQDLPAYNERQSDENDPFILMYGSDADVISNGRKYILNGSNRWIIQPQSGGGGGSSEAIDINYDNTQSGLSATNVQAAIDELEDTDDMQDRALAELYGEDANQQLEIDYAINTGAKNLLPNKYAIGTVTETNGFRFTAMEDGGIKIESIGTHNANGDYYILGNWGNTQTLLDLSGDTYTVTFSSATTISGVSLRIFGASNTPIINNLYINNSRDVTDVEVKFVFITVTSTTTLPADGIIVYPMIRNSVIRNSTFEPYAPTNRELYETKTSKEDVFGLGTALTTGLDLNNLTDIGTYYAPSTTIAQSLLNCPASYTFRLEVKTTNGTNRYMQTIYEVSTANGQITIYRRAYTVNGWQAWYKFEGTQVATVQSLNSTMTLNLNRNDLNEQLDSNFDLLDSIPEEEEGEEDV